MLLGFFGVWSAIVSVLHLIYWNPMPEDTVWFGVWGVVMLLASFVAVNLAYLVFLALWGLCLPHKPPKTIRPYASFMIWLTMDWLMTLLRVKLRYVGLEKLPDENVVLISNHVSNFDPMVVLANPTGRRLVYVSKIANFKLPIVGVFLRQAGFFDLDRNNPLKAGRTLRSASERLVNEHVDVGIYPEGTRTRTGKMGAFKEGAFLVAKKSNAPVVVCANYGLENMKHNWYKCKKTVATLEVLEVIPKETVAEMRMPDLAAHCYDLIHDYLYNPDETRKK